MAVIPRSKLYKLIYDLFPKASSSEYAKIESAMRAFESTVIQAVLENEELRLREKIKTEKKMFDIYERRALIDGTRKDTIQHSPES